MLRRSLLPTACLIMLVASPLALALIKVARPVQVFFKAPFIVVAKVEKIDAEKPLVMLKVEEDLRGKAAFRSMPVHFKGDADAEKLNHVPQLLKRLGPDLPVIFFVTPLPGGKNYDAFAFTNGTWFQLTGQQAGAADKVVWRLTHGEPFLRGTFKGTTKEMRQLVIDTLAGKAKPPGVNDKEPPGFGPEVPAKSSRGGSGGPLFGVIPTLGIGGPLAILALLFPTVFGGVLILFRQWLAFITVLSVNSTLLLLLRGWPGPIFPVGSWWNTDAALWFLMTLATFLCAVWAWRRQLTNQALGASAVEAPRRTEHMALWVMGGSCLLISIATPFISRLIDDHYRMQYDLAWVLMLTLTAGVLTGALYKLAQEYVPSATEGLSIEGVMIAVVLLGCLGYTAFRWGGDASAAAVQVDAGERVAAVGGVHAPKFDRVVWKFEPPNQTGLFAASPVIAGDRVYAAAALTTIQRGVLYSLDRHDGSEKWAFMGKDVDLKQMISTPTLAGGKLYMGEGFHEDPNCRMFCIDPDDAKDETTRQLWAFKTAGQTECSPCIANGKVFFGAGNEGMFCIDAADGKQVWRYPTQPRDDIVFRCGSTPVVVGNRVYSGSAVDRKQLAKTNLTTIFCLDADTGKERWKVPTSLPCWGAPVVADGKAYYSLGNGDVFSDPTDVAPAGALLCVDAETGNEVWRFDTKGGILDKPAVDAAHVWFGCRDGHVYCVRRSDGKLAWKRFLESPVIATPVLARCPGYAQTAHVFAVATAGKVACLDPVDGKVHWSVDLTGGKEPGDFSATPSLAVSRTPEGDRRRLYVGGSLGDLVAGRPVLFCLEDFVKVE